MATREIPEFVAPQVNAGRAEGKSLSVAYVDEEGRPVLSLRGSVTIVNGHQICLWLRHANGEMARSLHKNPNIAFLYRDDPSRTTYTFQGRARIETGEAERNRIFEQTPPDEQRHDPDRSGAAVLVEVHRFQAMYGGLPGVERRSPMDIQIDAQPAERPANA
jgi:hypothetical protein